MWIDDKLEWWIWQINNSLMWKLQKTIWKFDNIKNNFNSKNIYENSKKYKDIITWWIKKFKWMNKIHQIILFIFFYWLLWILFSNIQALIYYNYNYIWIIIKIIIAILLANWKVLNIIIKFFK